MIIRVPLSLKNEAIRDPENFVRDIANVTQQGLSPFFKRRKKILHAIKDYPNPFDPFKKRFDDDFLCKDVFTRYLHIDLGLKKDAVGIAMAHVPFFVDREELAGDSKKVVKVKAPVVKLDFWGRIAARKREEIILGEVRELIYELSRRHFYFGLITLDRFQSVDTIQILRSSGYTVGHMSVDRTSYGLVVDPKGDFGFKRMPTDGNIIACHQALKDLMYDDRLMVPNSNNIDYEKDYFVIELQEAQQDVKTGKVDHPPAGTIDVEQAIAASAFHCINNERMFYLTENEKIRKDQEDAWYKRREESTDKHLLFQNQFIGSIDPAEILKSKF
jgi:hypothetical protein